MTRLLNLISLIIFVLVLMSVNPSKAMCRDSHTNTGIFPEIDSALNKYGLYFIENINHISISSQDGLWMNLEKLVDGKYSLYNIGVTENNQTQMEIIFNDNGTISIAMDNVQPINREMFPAVYEAAEKCKDTEVGKYGMVQFYIRCYNEDDGSLKEEGWCCNFVEADNDFDYFANPLPIGVQKYYKDGKVVEKDETDKTIEGLLYYAEHYDEQRDFDCDHAE